MFRKNITLKTETALVVLLMDILIVTLGLGLTKYLSESGANELTTYSTQRKRY